MERLRANVWRQREQFAFDTHVPALLAFFREVINCRRPRAGGDPG
jgi:hypothetical protein